MDAIKFLKEKERMCDYYGNNHISNQCPMSQSLTDDICGFGCNECTPDLQVGFVEKWSKEHHIITNRMKFKEIFGHDYPYKTSAKCDAYTRNCKYINTKLMCATCLWWDEEYKEIKKDDEC